MAWTRHDEDEDDDDDDDSGCCCCGGGGGGGKQNNFCTPYSVSDLDLSQAASLFAHEKDS